MPCLPSDKNRYTKMYLTVILSTNEKSIVLKWQGEYASDEEMTMELAWDWSGGL